MSPRWTERFAVGLLCLLYFTASVYIAATKPYWMDETNTIGIASLPRLADVIQYFVEGREPHPPLPLLLIRLSFEAFGSSELSARLPSILSFFGALAALYLFLRRNFSVPISLAGAALLATGPAGHYATEARGYALLLCAAAFAALAWQRRSHAGLAGSLALAISAHYYAVLLAPVLAAASVVRDRRASLPTLAAISAGYAPLLFYAPLLQVALANGLSSWQYNPDNIARPSLDQLLQMVLAVIARLGIPLLLLAGAVLHGRRRGAALSTPLPLGERTLTYGLLLIPVVLLLLSKATVGAFFARYAIACQLGVALLAAALFAAACPRPAWQWAFVASSLAGPLLWPQLYLPKSGPAAELTAAWPSLTLPAELPLVHADALEFSTAWHYAPASVRRRLVYVHDGAVSRLTRDPVPEQTIQITRTVFPFRTEPYAGFVKSQPEFLMLSTGDLRREWLPQRLRTEGFRLETLGTLPQHTLYRVLPPQSSSD